MRRIVLPVFLAALAACSNQPFTLDVPLRVAASSPSSGTTGFARKGPDGSPAPVVVAFSEELDPATVTPAAFVLAAVAADGSLTPVPTSAPVSSNAPDGRFLVALVPSQRLAYSQKYRLTVSTALQRKRDHGRLPTTVKVEFTTEDPPPLAIIFTKPSEGGTGVTGPNAEFERTPTLKVRFSEPVDCASVSAANVVLTESFDPHPHTAAAARSVPGAWKCNAAPAADPNRFEGTGCLADTDPDDPNSQCVITFQPLNPVPMLSWSSALSLKLAGGPSSVHPLQSARATAASGQLPATATEHSTVIDPPALSLTASSPAAGAQGVERAAAVVLQFSEPIDCAQLKAAAKIEEVRDPHPHIPAPSAAQLEPGTTKTRLLWPGAGGSWACPDLTTLSPVDHSCGSDGSRCRVSFTPSSDTNNAAEGAGAKPLEYSSLVRVTLPGGGYGTAALLAARAAVESVRATSRGGELPAAAVFTFRTEDPPPLLLAGSLPGNGSTGVPRAATSIAFTFDQPIDCSENLPASTAVVEAYDPLVAARLGAASSGTLSGTAVACAGNTFTWAPAGAPLSWQFSSAVAAQLTAGTYGSTQFESALATSRGGQLAPLGTAPVSSAFAVVDPPPLLLVASSPTDGGVSAPLNAPLVLGFSRAVDPTTASHLAVLVSQAAVARVDGSTVSGGSVASASAVLTGASGFTWTPAGTYNQSAVVSAQLSSGASSSTGLLATDATTKGGWLVLGPVASGSSARTLTFRAKDPGPLLIAATQPNQSGQTDALANLTVTFSRAVSCGPGLATPGVGADKALSARDLTTAGLTPPSWDASCPAANKAQLALHDPSNPPRPLDQVQVTIAANVAAADATVLADGTVFGLLAQPATFTYTVQFAPLGVVSTAPSDGATAFPVGSDLQVVFTSPMSAASFKACTTPPATATDPGTPAGCNFQLLDTTASSATAASASTPGGAPGAGVTFHPTSSLFSGHSYRFTLYGGLYPQSSQTLVRLPNATGTTFLPQNVSFGFTAGNSRVVSSTSPSSSQANVPVGSPICITFTAALNTSTFTPGNILITSTSQNQGTLKMPWTSFSNTPSGSNTYCINLPVQTILDALGGQRTLLYGAAYTVTISSGVQLQSNPTPNELPLSVSFSTPAQPPQLQPVTYANAYVSASPLAGSTDVPLGAGFTVRLSDPAQAWVASSVTANGTVRLVQGTPPFASVPSPVSLAAASVSGGVFSVQPAAPLAFNTGYTLLLGVGQGGLQAQVGSNPPNWIDSGDGYDLKISLRTSRQTSALIAPYDPQISSELFVPIVFSRNAALVTATSAAIVGKQNGVPINGFVSEFFPVPTAVNFVAQPTWPNNVSQPQEVDVLDGLVLDEVGNPVAGAAHSWASTSNLSAITSKTPAAVNLAAPTPKCVYLTPAGVASSSTCNTLTGSGVNGVLGDQTLSVTFGQTALQDRMQPDTFSAATVTLTPNTGCSQGTAPIPVALTYLPACSLGSGCPASPSPFAAVGPADQLLIAPKGGAANPANRILATCTYALAIKQSQFTNLYGLTSGGSDLNFTLQGTSAPPTLAGFTATAQVPGATATALSTSAVNTGLPGRLSLSASLVTSANAQSGVATAIDPLSLPGNVLGTVTSGPGTVPSFTVTSSGATLTVATDAGQFFAAGSTYRLTFKSGGANGGIKDLAGNAIAADLNVDLSPDSSAPSVAGSVVYLSKSNAFPIFPNGAFKATFSKPMLAASFADATSSVSASGVVTVTPGTFNVVDPGGKPLLGAVLVDAANPAVAYFQPTGPTGTVIVAGTYAVAIGTAASDQQGNKLASAYGPQSVAVTTP